MIDIIEIFNSIIDTCRSIDVADRELWRQIEDDPEIKKAYIEWCDNEGFTIKKGFIHYCEECFDEEESRWDVLSEDESNYDF